MYSISSDTVDEPQARLCPSTRAIVVFMAFYACVITYMLRLNLVFTIVCMVELHNSSEDLDNCHHLNTTLADEGEFSWHRKFIGIILSSFFCGAILAQGPAGWLSEKFGNKAMLTIGLGVVAGLTLAIPEGSRTSKYILIAIRFFQGFGSSTAFPPIHWLIGVWSAPRERPLLMSLSYSGMYVGSILIFPISSALCAHGFAGGWPSVFYVTGCLGILWTVLTSIFVCDNPENNLCISDKELHYLGYQKTSKMTSVPPWKAIFLSKAVWAINISHFCGNWGLFTLILHTPLYMTEVLKFDIFHNGLLCSVPYVCTVIMSVSVSHIFECMKRKDLMSLTLLRKIYNTIGMIIPGILMACLGLLTCHERYYAFAMIVIAQAVSAVSYSGGFFYNHLDIAPQHAVTLMIMSNIFGQIPGILSPILMGFVTPDANRKQWAIVFYVSAAMYFVGATTYLIFGSSKRQPWGHIHHSLLHVPREHVQPITMVPPKRMSVSVNNSSTFLVS